jgi:hypothetical protein
MRANCASSLARAHNTRYVLRTQAGPRPIEARRSPSCSGTPGAGLPPVRVSAARKEISAEVKKARGCSPVSPERVPGGGE